MTFYPAYKAGDVLDEYAITFYTLLEEGYRIQAKHYEMLAAIGELPTADETARKEFYKNLGWAAMRPGDILKPSRNDASPDQIKKLLNGK